MEADTSTLRKTGHSYFALTRTVYSSVYSRRWGAVLKSLVLASKILNPQTSGPKGLVDIGSNPKHQPYVLLIPSI